MDIAVVANAITSVVKLINTLDIGDELRNDIAVAVKEGRDLTEEELQKHFDSAQSAIDKARED